MRPDTTRRRPTIAEAMILIASTAVGLALVRVFHGSHLRPRLWDGTLGGPVIYAVPMLAAWSPGVLASGLRRCGPRRAVRGPGPAACLVAVLAVSCQCAFAAADMADMDTVGPATYTFMLVMGITPVALLAGFGVLAVWCQMALAGRWRPEPTWVDRAGRALGVAWVAAGGVMGFEL